MKKYKRSFAIVLALILLLNISPVMVLRVLADVPLDPDPLPPSFSQADKAATVISHDKNDINGNYWNRIKIQWTPTESWGNPDAYDRNYYSLSLVPRNGGQGITVGPIGSNVTSYTFDNPGVLKSGTVYDITVRANHDHLNQYGYVVSVHSSPPSNVLSVLTDIELRAMPATEYSIEIQWDDVIINGQRIDYEIYISTHKDFKSTLPIYVRSDMVGNGKAVKPVMVDGRPKLTYTHTEREPGTVCYVKIKPVIPANRNIVYNPETETVVTYTYIAASMTLYSSSDSGNWWKINWNPIVEGVTDGQDISYSILRANEQTADVVLQQIKSPPQYLLIKKEDEGKYYYRIMVANFMTQIGETINIFSDKLETKIQDIPYTPIAPVIKETLEEEKMTVTQNSATMLWEVTTKPGGGRDEAVKYDMWLLRDIEQIDALKDPKSTAAPAPTVADFVPTSENFIIKSNTVQGYKYTIDNLIPNTVYYFAIKAKRSFQVENEEGVLETREFVSEPAFKAIITPPDDMGQPETIAKPPLMVGKVNKDSIEIKWKRKWYEIMPKQEGASWSSVNQQGELLDEEEYNSVDTELYYKRIVEFTERDNVSYVIGYIPFTNDLDGSEIRELDKLPNAIHTAPIRNNPSTIDQTYTLTEQIRPNTEYLIWIKVIKAGYMSDVSNALVVTTPPDYEQPSPVPIVPTIWDHVSGDTYIDLTWWGPGSQNLPNPKHTYYLCYAKEDDISKALRTITIPYNDLLLEPDGDTLKQYYTVTGLEPNTWYYFWVMAENEQKQKSDWSDSYAVSTFPYQPPETPYGFGVKGGDDAVGKNHITFEWVRKEGLYYVLEVSEDIEGKNMRSFTIQNAGEYKVTGLESNRRYFAVLYALDPKTGLRSRPTSVVSVRTLRSDDEYDSDTDTERVIDEDIIDSRYEDGVWITEIVGINADRFIEMIYKDSYVDYVLDLSNPSRSNITKRHVRISYKVFTALSQVNEYLKIDIGKDKKDIDINRTFTFRPNTIVLNADMGINNAVVNLFFTDMSSSSIYQTYGSSLISKSKATNLEAWVESSNMKRVLQSFNNPIIVEYPFEDTGWDNRGKVQGYVYDDKAQEWKMLETTPMFSPAKNVGYAIIAVSLPGKIAVFKKEDTIPFTDVYGHWVYDDILRLVSAYDLPSIRKDTRFRPDDIITMEEGVKLILDVLGYKYGDNYSAEAYKAGITKDVKNISFITRQEAISMLARLYEIKTGQRAEAYADLSRYKDANLISATYLPAVRFAVSIGILAGKSGNTLAPGEKITRAEMAAMLRRLMKYIGEIG
ncbi:MAG: hypothetical protein GX066_02645 [Clostridiaceae bacterium]|nr:hypothetical protein [Clostridiaceae bacterium]